MKTKQTLALLACLFLLSACGDKNSSSTITTLPSTPPPVATNAAGIWDGWVRDPYYPNVNLDFNGMITETGDGWFYDQLGTQYIVSNVSGYDGNVTIDFMAVTQSTNTFLDGSAVTTGSISGTLVEGVSFDGNYSLATGESEPIHLKYDPLYERYSTLARLEGMWDQIRGNGQGTLIVDADGSFFEQNRYGCVFNGQVSIIDSNYSVYALSMTVSLCDDIPDLLYGLNPGVPNGWYTGLGVLSDRDGGMDSNDSFSMYMHNGTLIFTALLLR